MRLTEQIYQLLGAILSQEGVPWPVIGSARQVDHFYCEIMQLIGLFEPPIKLKKKKKP